MGPFKSRGHIEHIKRIKHVRHEDKRSVTIHQACRYKEIRCDYVIRVSNSMRNEWISTRHVSNSMHRNAFLHGKTFNDF